jgi:TolB-like protein/lipoprotein NlpI
MAQIFVSYSSEDVDRVRPLVKAIEALDFTVWWDRQIDPGTSWDDAIERELDAAQWVIAVWTERSIGSRWVRTESMAALDRDVLIPVLLDDVTPPVAFRTTQAADLRNWQPGSPDAGFDQLMALLQAKPASSPRPVASAPVTRTAKPNRRKQLIVAASIVGLLATAAVLTTMDTEQAPETPAPVTTFTGQPSIAVLAFDHGTDPEDRPFADGLTDEIIKGLQQYRSFPVMSRHSSFAFRDSGLSLAEVGARLGAQYLVTGSVQRRGDRLRVAAGLASAEGQQMWSETFEVDFVPAEVFRLQDEIAQQIAGITYPQLLASEIERVGSRDTDSLEAWTLAVNAIDIIYGIDMSRLDEGLAYAERALALDPELSIAYWARAEIGVYQYVEHGLVGAGADVREKELLADFEEALRISPFDGALCGCLGFVRTMRGELDAAEAMFDTVLPVNPSNALLRMNYATFLTHQDDLDTARREAELAIRLDPISRFGSMAWSTLGLIDAVEGNLDGAINLTRRGLQLERNETWGQAQLPVLLYLDGQVPSAQDAFANLMRDHPRLTPRNKFIYGWMRPIEAQIRDRVASESGEAHDEDSLADLIEWIYRELGWEPRPRVTT